MRRTHVTGRLDYCRPLDRWQVIDIDGQCWPLQPGQRIILGDLQGVTVYAVLLRQGLGWTWAVTDTPSDPAPGGLVTIRIDDAAALSAGCS